MTLSDILEMNKMEKEQLMQLCDALYSLLQEHNVNVSLQQPFVPIPPAPLDPFFPPSFPGGWPTTGGGMTLQNPNWWVLNADLKV